MHAGIFVPNVLFDARLRYRRLHELAHFAESKRVRLMVDAEQTYLQPAIDHCVHQLQRRMNVSFPTIFNTFQCYLTDTPSRITLDLERARQGGCVIIFPPSLSFFAK